MPKSLFRVKFWHERNPCFEHLCSCILAVFYLNAPSCMHSQPFLFLSNLSSHHHTEVNNRLTGWAFAHLVNKFANPVNSTCQLPKIAHPVNYLAHRKMGSTITKNRQFRHKSAILTNPKGKISLK